MRGYGPDRRAGWRPADETWVTNYSADEPTQLLRPTISPMSQGPKPWRLEPQLGVAVLGGVVACTALALLNARRLDAPEQVRRQLLQVGLACFVAEFVLLAVLEAFGAPTASLWLVLIGASVLAYLLQARLVRRYDRAFQRRDGEYAPLWKPGLIAAFGGRFVDGAAMFGLLILLSVILR